VVEIIPGDFILLMDCFGCCNERRLNLVDNRLGRI